MPQDVTQELLERHGQLDPQGRPFVMPEALQGLLAPVLENPPGEDDMRKAMSFYLSRYDFPQLQTALQQAGVGDYSRSPAETIPAGLQGFLQAEGSMEPDERERQAKIFLSMLQGGGGPATPF